MDFLSTVIDSEKYDIYYCDSRHTQNTHLIMVSKIHTPATLNPKQKNEMVMQSKANIRQLKPMAQLGKENILFAYVCTTFVAIGNYVAFHVRPTTQYRHNLIFLFRIFFSFCVLQTELLITPPTIIMGKLLSYLPIAYSLFQILIACEQFQNLYFSKFALFNC